MGFDVDKVLWAGNKDKAVIDNKYVFADNLYALQNSGEEDILKRILDDNEIYSFEDSDGIGYMYAYPVEEPRTPCVIIDKEYKGFIVRDIPTGAHVYFTGTVSECEEWINLCPGMGKVAHAWEHEGAMVQVWTDNGGTWEDCLTEPLWSATTKYRVKPKWRPFKDVDELIYTWERLTGRQLAPMFMPEIWVHQKDIGSRRLITTFETDTVNIDATWLGMQTLFDQFEFLDGTPCGVKE